MGLECRVWLGFDKEFHRLRVSLKVYDGLGARVLGGKKANKRCLGFYEVRNLCIKRSREMYPKPELHPMCNMRPALQDLSPPTSVNHKVEPITYNPHLESGEHSFRNP